MLDQKAPLPSAPITRVCVYCGSRFGADPLFRESAEALGRALAEAGITLIYGAGSVGLMGATAQAVMAVGGDVVGIIPEHLDRVEITQPGLSELHVTRNMHDRKRLMFEKSDAFVILPGGLGTLDETFEIVTWCQLGLHAKPIIVLNIGGYWDPLLDMVRSVVDHGFAGSNHADLLQWTVSVPETMDLLKRLKVDPSAVDSSLL